MKVSIHPAVVLVFGWGVLTFGQSQPASRPTSRPTSLPTTEHGRFVSLPTGVLFLPNTLKTPVESIDLLVFFHPDYSLLIVGSRGHRRTGARCGCPVENGWI